MAGLGQTISVIDKSGKVVSTSKHLFGVFKEARSAYRDRKAVIQAEERGKRAERDARRALANYHIEERGSETSSKRHLGRSGSVMRHGGHHHHSGRSHRRASMDQDRDRGIGIEFYPDQAYNPAPGELARRHTSHTVVAPEQIHPGTRSKSVPHVDMDLAYGEFHPSALERLEPPSPDNDEDLNGLVGRAKGLLVEADCAQHTATAMITHLQQQPDAMAAVALTLAEISKLARRLGPAAFTLIKTSAPAVFALLSSPQFLIAAGVGIGVTVVMFGGYKIIKQIQANTGGNNPDPNLDPNLGPHDTAGPQQYAPIDGPMDEMFELNPHVNRIEDWRRGVADSEAESVGTSVDGEFITPTAAAMSNIWGPENDRVSQLRRPSKTAPSSAGSSSSNQSGTTSSSRSSRTSRSSRRSRTSSTRDEADKKDKKKKEKKDGKEKKSKLSPLRQLLKV